MILLFFILLHVYVYAAQDFPNKELIDEMVKLRQIVKSLESNMKEQQMTIKAQGKQIEALQNVVNAQDIELKALKHDLNELRNQRTKGLENSVVIGETKGTNGSKELLEGYKTSSDKEKIIRKGRIIPHPTSTNMIAFYAYMSSTMSNVGAHHTLIFDTAVTNVGDAYHPNSGVFIAPVSGLYVFSWSIRSRAAEIHIIELMVNGKAVAKNYHYTLSNEDQYAGTTAVIQIAQGDDVFLRTGAPFNHGGIWSDASGFSSFTGWKLN